MPLFAKLFGSITAALVALFSQFLGFKVALKLAAYTTWIVTFTALLVSVYVCLSSIYGALSSAAAGGGSGMFLQAFFMGVGIFIPSNAGALIACYSSIWIATNIYKVQKQGIFQFGS